MGDPTVAVFMQLLPSLLMQTIMAVLTFRICRKRGVAPWGWVIATLIPVVGLFVWGFAFVPTSIMHAFDRIRSLEGQASGDR